jgi:RNA polymerase sigma-70 factor, ECF subfamily
MNLNPQEHMSDESEIIRLAQKGDLEAFNQLVLAYQDMAFNTAYRILSDADNACDAAQTALISAYRNIKRFRGGSFRAWLMRIVTNACYDEFRKRKRQPTIPLEPAGYDNQPDLDTVRWLTDKAPTPEQAQEIAELDQAIQHCLDKLPQDFRVVVVLVDLEGLDYKEASRIVSKPLGTIKSRLARARVRLQSCLQQFRELLPDKFRLEDEAFS